MKTALTLLLSLFVVTICHGTIPPIVFKRVDTYEQIYNDRGTGAYKDVSIWRPVNTEYGYYALGDVAVATHNEPTAAAIMVKALTAEALRAPLRFSEIWNDRGSGGEDDVRVMQMIPPSGYVCLGHVAILGYSNTPNSDKYRCVQSQYVTTGTYELIWLDRGSGADRDVGFWGNHVSDTNLLALDANTFTSFGSHSNPGGAPSMLNGTHAKNHLSIGVSYENYVFTLYEVTDMAEIWNDRGSGANEDVAIWRSRGASNSYSLGDIAVRGGRPHRGFVVKAHRDDALQAPYGFRKVWDDSGSGARWDGAFYKPLCNTGYRPLGHVAMRNHHENPPNNAIRCVKASYTIAGRWSWIWNDRGSGADDDVSVWKAIPNGRGQGVEAMSTIRHHGNMDVGAYVLIPEQVNYVVGKPARRYILSNVTYLFNDRNIAKNEPETMQRTIIENRGATEQQITRGLLYQYEETYTWSHNTGLEIGVEATVSAGVPLISSAEVTTSIKTSYSYNWGGSKTVALEDTVSVQINVKPHSQKSAIVVGNRYTVDVPYTAILITEYEDGTRTKTNNFRGIYYGVQVNAIRVVIEDDVPLIN